MANNSTFTLNIKALFDASDVKAKVGDIQKAFSNLKLPDNLKKNLDDSFSNLNKALSDFESRAAKGVKTKADAKGLTGSMDNVIKEFTKVQDIAAKVRAELGDSVDLSKIIKLDDNTVKKLTELQNRAKSLKNELANITSNTTRLQNLSNLLSKIKGEKTSAKASEAFQLFKEGDIDRALQKIDQLIAKQNQLVNGAANRTGTIDTNLEQLTQIRTELVTASQEAQKTTAELGKVTQEQADVAKAAFDKEAQSIDKANQSIQQFKEGAQGVAQPLADAVENQVRLNTELDQVKSRIQYFFGLANSIILVKRAIHSAVETVKELDAAMTKTAVVTDYTVKDMWNQLPEYTKRANELGVMTKDAYESATLYFQQGLNADQAAALSVETLKMARIAGLDAAEATDRMTNALRGFNMELDTASAQRVDDVYSELAAISASDVDEISTAMTKVASLAHSANMEFETTAAFLAQIIETTRESAETAGTALKTVVARFSEVKKLVDTDQLKGTDEEGQVIDVNKVSAALRTAGIDLNKYFLGEVGLDDIFMELASKWDSLNSVQQRYIATQAAGSRQQSRFIALMQDYARTQDLVGAAYNAEGASARQFEKTQDSLQSKLARLKNAWNEFLMGITNSGVIKGAIDALTTLLNIINKITGAFGPATSGFLKFGVAAATIFAGKKAFSSGGIAERALGSLGNTKLGTFLGFGGNTNTQITSAGTAFHGEVVSAGAEFAAAVRGAAGVEAAAGGAGGVGAEATRLRLSPWKALKKFKADNAGDATAYKVYQQMSAEAAALGEKNLYQEELNYYRPTNTLFGVLGKKFGATKFGGKVASGLGAGLGKLGIGSGAAVSGAAALAATIGTITVAAGAAAIAIKAMYDASPAGQLKMAEKYADSMSDVASSAQKAALKIRSVADRTKEYESAIRSATSVSERGQAIQDQNEYILSLLEEDAAYAQYIQSTFTEGGQLYLTLDSNTLAAAVDKITEGATRASAHSQLAQAIAQQQTADYYRNKLNGIDLVNRTKTVEAGDYQTQVRLTDQEYAKYLGYQQRIDTANVAMQNYAATAASQLVDTDKIGTEFGQTIASTIGATFNADEILKSARGQDWVNTLFNWDRSELEIRYKELYGGDASELKRADLIDKVAMGEALQEAVEGPIGELTKLFEDNNKAEDINTLLNSFLGQGDFISRSMAGLDINNDAAIYQWLGVVDNLDQFEQNMQDLASALGIETGELLSRIKKQAKDAKKQQAQNVWNTSNAMARGGVSTDNIKTFLGLDFEDQQIFQSLYDSFDAQYLTDEVTNSLLQGIQSGDSEFNNWIKNLNLSNPIQAFNQLSQAAATGNDSIISIAQALLEADKSVKQFSASSQLAFLTTSDSYDEISESLAKFKEENGTISSANIKELAETSADLAAILDSGTMSAKGLAVALEGIETSKFTILDLSDAVLAAMSAMDDLDGIVQDTINDLNSFDPGYDENDITSFINKVFENATENFEKGAYGNNVMGNYMREIFGDFKWDGTGDYGNVYKQWLESNIAWLDANKENMFSAWDDFIGQSNERILTSGEKTAEILEQNGEIIINANGMTTEELVNAMVEQGHMTETMARMMISDFKNYSADFAHEMAENDMPGAIQAWMDALPEIDGSKIYDEADLNTLGTLFGKSADEIKEVVDQLNKTATEYRGIKWTNDDGQRTVDSIKSALSEAGVSITGTDGLFDYNAIKQAYADLGIPQMFENDFNTIASESGEFWASFFGGEPTKISIEEGQNAGEAYAQAYQQAVNKDLATQLSQVFKEQFAEFEISVDPETGLAAIQEVENQLTDLGEKKTNPTITANNTQALTAIQSVIDKLAEVKNKTVTVTTITKTEVGTSRGGTTLGQGATGGVVQSYASGSENTKLQPGMALTGEEGPEIVWNKDKGYAYITGEQHPEFQNLQPGDRVFNAQETKKILSGAAAGGKVSSFARGYGGATSSKKSSGGSGGGSGSGGKDKTSEEWRNDLDWLYNLMEDIAELERDQKAIEEQYKDLLVDQNKTGKDLYKLLIQQLGNLYTQLEHQQFALEKREQEMREFMDITNDQDQYLWYNWQDRTLEIDWDAIDQITDEDLYKHVKDLIDEAEDIQGKIDDADDSIMDITNQIQELENIWRDTFIDFENRVLDAIIKSYQQIIDNYSELNDTLNNSNQQILDSLQKQISLERQIRDNTKTEEEIADDEARLAYLRRDTSGGNELAALQLERELADQRESYEDTLVDQAISRLQEDNDAAAQQRERQIEIMQAQLDYQSENGEFNAYMRELLDSAIGDDGELLTNSELYNLLREQENWEAMSEVNKQVWEEELNNTFKEVVAFLLKENSQENGTFYTALTAAVSSVSTAIGSYSQAMVKLGNSITSAGSSGGGGGSGGGSYSSSGPSKSPQSTIPASTIRRVGGCFAPGTKILMADNSIRNIEFIKIGDVVIAYNELTGDFVPKKVTKSYVHYNTPAMVKLTFNDNSILKLTPGHPLYSTHGWKSLDIENSLYEHGTVATLLRIGDEIIGITGNKIVKSIEWLNIGLNYSSYNIEVEDCHTFLAEGLVAHNIKVRFATGGLADSTGLAWLDGTPQEPEYVLNARQTDAFLKLADVLPSMMNNTSVNTSNAFGSTYVNLSVNLESVSPDYDVDRMVDLVKDKLYDSGSYRNNNVLSFLR